MPNLGGIGVISSISCGQTFTDAFEGAVAAAIGAGNQFNTTYLDEVGVDLNSISAAVRSFAADASIKLIVTFGGRIAFDAANTVNGKVFISLLGEVPSVVGGKCMGGISTESYARNQPRSVAAAFTAGNANVAAQIGATVNANETVAFTPGQGGALPPNVTLGTAYTISPTGLGPNSFQFKDAGGATITPTTAGTPPILAWIGWNSRICLMAKQVKEKSANNISLLYHPSSPLAQNEITLWTSSAWPALNTLNFPAGPGGPVIAFRSNKGFVDAFDRIQNDTIIVSADPFFQEHKEELINAANQSGKTVCYPYGDYRNRRGLHKPRQAYMYGPALRDIIAKMGTVAGTYLGAPGNQGFTQLGSESYGTDVTPIR